MITISQVALFNNPKVALDLGRAMWAALEEIERFYNFGETRAIFKRTFLSERLPEGLRLATDQGLIERFRQIGKELLSRRSTKQYARTFEYRTIVEIAREALLPAGHDGPCLIVTDLELMPPPDWRYIIFDGNDDGVVISTAPTDPQYWGEKDPDRIAIIKHRVRTAGLNSVGQLLGLSRCDNPECFLHQPIDSVTCLDAMIKLGPEHGLPGLAGLGFESRVEDPAIPQPVKRNPMPLEAR